MNIDAKEEIKEDSNFKYCVNCLTKCPTEAVFCTNCGEKEFADSLDTAQIKKKEIENTKYCAKCGAKNEKSNKHCYNCGHTDFYDSLDEFNKHKKSKFLIPLSLLVYILSLTVILLSIVCNKNSLMVALPIYCAIIISVILIVYDIKFFNFSNENYFSIAPIIVFILFTVLLGIFARVYESQFLYVNHLIFAGIILLTIVIGIGAAIYDNIY